MVLSLSAQYVTSPPLVVTDTPLACVMAALALSSTSPAAPALDVFRLALTLMLPPYAVMGPLMVVAFPSVISAVLPDLPSVNPVTVEPKLRYCVFNAVANEASSASG